jgi:branched-chain amino acid transport system permease protein
VTSVLQLLVSGVALGAIYAMVALGFVLVFKATDVLNFAHGEFLVIGCFLTLGLLMGGGVPVLPALLIIVAVMAALGVILHYGVMRPLVGQPLFTVVLATIGIAIIVRAGILIAAGPQLRGRVTALPRGAFLLGGVRISYIDVSLIVASALCVCLFYLLFMKTSFGARMRAVADNLEAAAAMGIDPNRVFAAAWAIGAIMAGIGGFFYANVAATIHIGVAAIGLRAFPAAMIGGLSSVEGAIIGGIIVGLVEQFSAAYLGADWRDVSTFGLMFVILIVRPYGIFGRPPVVRV